MTKSDLTGDLTAALGKEFAKPKPRKQKSKRSSGGNLSRNFARSLAWYADHPVAFVEDVIGATPDDWQRDVLNALLVHDKVAVASCTGAGKDALASWAIAWVTVCYPYSKNLATAPSGHLLDDVLWAECHKWIRNSLLLDRILEWRVHEIRHRAEPAEWFTAARCASVRYGSNGQRQVEGLAGIHADYSLLIVDEASGVLLEHFETLEGTMTGRWNKMLVIGNPLRTDGRFFEIFNKPNIAKNWCKFYVGAIGGPYLAHTRKSDTGKKYISGHASKQNALQLIETYGEMSSIVQARVFGNFPTHDSIDTVFSYVDVMDAMRRQVIVLPEDEVQIGVDCARFGDDETVFTIRRGVQVRQEVMAMSDGPTIAGHIAKLCELEADLTRPYWNFRPLVQVDVAEAGGGAGACDWLWKQGYENVVGVNFGSTQNVDQKLYLNLAASMWMKDLVEWMPKLSLPEDERLMQQLLTRKYEYTGMGPQRRLERKEMMKKRNLGSPDRADSLCLAVYKAPTPGVF